MRGKNKVIVYWDTEHTSQVGFWQRYKWFTNQWSKNT